jgi:ankyrin repeat protein
MTSTLLTFGADPAAANPAGMAALHLAAQSDAVDAARLLIDAGADPARRSKNGMSALDWAAEAGSTEVIRLLLDSGMDPDAQSDAVSQGHGYPRDVGTTPLGIAVRAGRLDAVEEFLAGGADVDARSSRGNTPLLIAVYFDSDSAIVARLLAAGADPEVRGACFGGCARDYPDPRGRTAAEWAEYLGRHELAAILHQI